MDVKANYVPNIMTQLFIYAMFFILFSKTIAIEAVSQLNRKLIIACSLTKNISIKNGATVGNAKNTYL
jgi:hypothetical protein